MSKIPFSFYTNSIFSESKKWLLIVEREDNRKQQRKKIYLPCLALRALFTAFPQRERIERISKFTF